MTPDRALRLLLQAGDPIRGAHLIRRAVAKQDRVRARKQQTTLAVVRRQRLKSALEASWARLQQGLTRR